MVSSSNIQKIFIDGIRCFKNFEIDLTADLNVLVGPNAVGKSTLLQILAYFLNGSYRGDKYLSLPNLFGLYHTENGNNVPYVAVETSEVDIDSRFLKDVWPSTMVCSLTESSTSYMENTKKLLIEDMKGKSIQRAGLLNLNDLKGKKASFIFALIGSGSSYNERVLVNTNNKIYYIYQSNNLGAQKILEKLKILSLSYNHSDYKNILFETLEGKREMKDHFNKVIEDSTILINKLSKSSNYRYIYKDKPILPHSILNEFGKNIENVSSGEQQLNSLDVFFNTVYEVNPSVVIIDEPELHLNYSQLPFVTSKIRALSNQGIQVLIATHSTFFIRWAKIDKVKLLKTVNNSTKLIKLQDTKLLRKYLPYPEVFFCRKIIAVESIADKIFFERTLGVLSKYLDNKSLDQRNIEIIAGYGKAYMRNIFELSKNLETGCFFIVDKDFFLQEVDFSFLGKDLVKSINILRNKLVKLDYDESSKRTFGLNKEIKLDFFKLIYKIFSQGDVTKKDILAYNNRFKNLVEKYSYEDSVGLLKFVKGLQLNKIRNVFRKQNIWLLQKGTIDIYVKSLLKIDGKLSVDKLQLNYYPSKFSELRDYIDSKVIDEFKKLAEEITRWDRS